MATSLEILLADPEPDHRQILTHQLERLGHRVVPVWKGELALDLCLNQGRQFDIVIIDMLFGGAETIARLRAHRMMGNTRIIATSTGPQTESLQAGADIPFPIPFDRWKISEAIDQALLHRAEVSTEDSQGH